MAKKNIYFFRTSLINESGVQLGGLELKSIINEIINSRGRDLGDHFSVDLTPYEEMMHVIFDAYEFRDRRLFGRFSKQLPKNSMMHHAYDSLEDSEVLPGVDERMRGIEKDTYGMLDYETGIWAFVLSQSAPNEKVLKTLVERFKEGYSLELYPIPNTEGINRIFNGEDPEITKIEIECALLTRDVLENTFGWHDEELLESLERSNLRYSAVLKGESRRSISDNSNIVQRMIDAINLRIGEYSKAKMVAKTRTIKGREYNFFIDNFSYPIDISPYRIKDSEKVYLSKNELLEIYRQNINISFNDSRGILECFIE